LESNVPGQPISGDGSRQPAAPADSGRQSAAESGPTKPICTDLQADAAGSEADQLKSWGAVYRWFRRYTACDDGYISEGYSDSVVRLLATRWNRLQELHRLTLRNRAFESFVLKHIDPTVPKDELKKVEDNARKRCPKGAESLCGSIHSAAKQAEAEAY